MSDLWVFGYGSLMWRPGFSFVEHRLARLPGAHRSLCVYSWVHRGTQQRPGLVLGLDQGGACRGIAFRVEQPAWQDTLTYLREREQVTRVYIEHTRPILFDDGSRADALTYVVDRSHDQYAGKLDKPTQLTFVRGAMGQSGHNRDYVINTAQHLDELGINDPQLSWLANELKHDGEPART